MIAKGKKKESAVVPAVIPLAGEYPTATSDRGSEEELEDSTIRIEGALGHEMCCMYSCSVVCGGEFAKKCTL